MIKLSKHRLTCDCEHCRDTFPLKRFEPTWSVPGPPTDGARAVRGHLPIGDPHPAMHFGLWMDDAECLLVDWPGLPGTAGARVRTRAKGPSEPPVIVDTDDPILRGFTSRIPLRRKLQERLNARCLVEFGLAQPDAADHIACEEHGQGVPALTCPHLMEPQPREVVVLYGLDGDFPDVLCQDCLQALAGGDTSVCLTTCSVCQRVRVLHHHVVATTYYGARPG
ncbi:MAG: hypothetical protein ACQEXJ_05110 [Myxococcota bacterium]